MKAVKFIVGLRYANPPYNLIPTHDRIWIEEDRSKISQLGFVRSLSLVSPQLPTA